MDFPKAPAAATGCRAIRTYVEMQQSLTGCRPQTDVRKGVAEFVAWYRSYYGR